MQIPHRSTVSEITNVNSRSALIDDLVSRSTSLVQEAPWSQPSIHNVVSYNHPRSFVPPWFLQSHPFLVPQRNSEVVCGKQLPIMWFPRSQVWLSDMNLKTPSTKESRFLEVDILVLRRRDPSKSDSVLIDRSYWPCSTKIWHRQTSLDWDLVLWHSCRPEVSTMNPR